MTRIREPAVAGSFYPADPHELQALLDTMLSAVDGRQSPPKAMIAPHAGYIYSGPIAATGYARLKQVADQINRVVLLGPAHHKAFTGIAVPSATAFSTPLGLVTLDTAVIQQLLTQPYIHSNDDAHQYEHSLEVHLPFLQSVLNKFMLVPLLVGNATASEVCEVIEQLWGGGETLLIISSDLSHYHDYETAVACDRATSAAIEALAFEEINHLGACGSRPVNGLLRYARQHGLAIKTIDLRNSGDTAGSRDRVVGYATCVLTH